jgi:hypothetical protein
MSIRSDGSGPTSHSHDGAPRGGSDGARKKSVPGKKADKNLEREKDRRRDEEKDQLLARIGESIPTVPRLLRSGADASLS